MTRRQWTLLLVSDHETGVRQYRFSRDMVRLAVAVLFVAVSTFSSFATAVVMKRREPNQTVRLEQKNAALKSEIKDIRKQIISLNTHLDLLAKQDEQFRLVAGLEPLSDDVKRVGIGGPGGGEIMEDAAAASAASHVSELLRRARLLSFSWREAKTTLDDKTERMQSTPSIVPTTGFFSSGFSRNRFHPILQYARPHEGVDITAPKGTPIVAAAKGVVLRAEYDRDYGYVVDIDHGYGVSTRYAHASKTLVRRGQAVTRGERIALVGETGLAVGPHLHYEVRLNGKPANPLKYFLNTNAIVD